MNVWQRSAAVGLVGLGILSTPACLNEFKSAQPTKGEPSKSERLKPGSINIFDQINQYSHIEWPARERALRASAAGKAATVENKSDYAVALLHLGKTREALGILEPLALANPTEYRVIANLGTAYELAGRLEKARTYILKGIELNPKSHEGTEWLHVKILDAKIALAKDPSWLKTHTVLGHDFGNQPAPILPATLKGQPAEIAKTSKAVIYQLRERLQFVKPPDATVSDLMFYMGNFYDTVGSTGNALPFYRAALNFDATRKPLIDTRVKRLATVRAIRGPSPAAETRTQAALKK